MRQNPSLIFRADYIEHHFEARAMLPPISDVLCNRLFCCLFLKSISFVMKKSATQPIELFRNGIPDKEQYRGGSVEQDSTMGPNFTICSICPSWNLVGECLPQTLHLFCFRRSDGIRRPTIFTNEGGTE